VFAHYNFIKLKLCEEEYNFFLPSNTVSVRFVKKVIREQTKKKMENIINTINELGLQDIRFNREGIESLIYWRDVKKSGVVFGAGLAILLALSFCSLISVFAYVSLFVLLGTVAFRIYKNIMQAIQKTSEGHPFKEYLEQDLTLSQDRVQQVATVAVSHANAAITELRRLFLVEDLVDSIKFAVLLYCLTYVGALFNGMTLIILTFIGLFTLPKVYETNKTVIDAQFDIVRSKITELTDKVKAVIPIGKKAAETEKDK